LCICMNDMLNIFEQLCNLIGDDQDRLDWHHQISELRTTTQSCRVGVFTSMFVILMYNLACLWMSF
jgi:hypothetical protein